MIRALLAGAIDYAGLFPPAGLAMPAAVANYHEYRRGADAWALGRFVVPAARLAELAAAAAALPQGGGAGEAPGTPWRISALVAGDGAADLEEIRRFNARHSDTVAAGWTAVVDTVEARAASVAGVDALAAHHDPATGMFVEVPAGEQGLPLLDALAHHRLAAKIRAGGVAAAQFPTAQQVAAFLAGCARLALPFKATAGLHHPLRAEYPLTYAPDSERGTMFGFLNVFLAAAAARAGAGAAELAALLEERELAAIAVDPGGATWRGRRITAGDMESVRARFALSFGSCSFEEPLSDLRTLGLL